MIPKTKTLDKLTEEKALTAYNFYKMLAKDSFVLMYMGIFDDQLTSILMDINDAGKFEMKSSRKKISFLIAECFQNIVRHSDEENKAAIGFNIPEMFLLRNRKTMHHLVTTNIVRNADRAKLTKSIDHLKTLSKEELKELYMDVFTNGNHLERGGAGLGLIEMARRSGTAPTYKFEALGNNFSNFFFQVNVLPADFEGAVTENETTIQPALSVYDKMTEQKVVLLQKGDFSKEAIMPLISLFENNLTLKAEDLVVMKKVITLLVEMLENIRDHAKQMNGFREGIFYVAEKSAGKYEINTGNFIPVSQKLILEERLDSISKLMDKELKKNKKTSKLSDGEKFNPGVGLAEICKNSSEN